ncbi:hypothetical protein [Sulfurovum sp.]|jgi:hypothetical protein|uniref:hypothetical protein n=1 Tax=Sulfurovum sp. TaxID=1969726 RepID=UPI0025E56806|nr:hypothetical protein [Sulfurovum sp.]
MSYIKTIKTILLIGTVPFFTACAPNQVPENEGGYYYSGVYFGTGFSLNYKKGIQDGCTTAKGTYKKSHWLFKNNNDYNNGWFLGRNRCKHLLVIEDE